MKRFNGLSILMARHEPFVIMARMDGGERHVEFAQTVQKYLASPLRNSYLHVEIDLDRMTVEDFRALMEARQAQDVDVMRRIIGAIPGALPGGIDAVLVQALDQTIPDDLEPPAAERPSYILN